VIKLEGIHKRFDMLVALRGITLEVERASTLVLIGPSGCGKSTLLKTINGLVSPDSGTVSIRGEILSPTNLLKQRQRMGYVIQQGGLFPHLNAGDNVTLVARHLRWTRNKIRHRLDALLDLVQLPPDRLERYPHELSGGQRQRIGLMRALMLDPDILLLDEPLGALDPLIRADLQDDLKHIVQQLHKTVILVTHDMGEAAFFSDRIALMREGELIQVGDLRDFIEHPASPFVTRFLNAQRGLHHALDDEEDAP